MMGRLPIFLFLSFWTTFAFSQNASSPLFWPLDCPPAMTSAFGDYRTSRFHFGMDIKTWGKTGFPVRAEADGFVLRVNVSTRGYGKALYVQLRNGETRVYGHLSGFNARLDSMVLNQQYKEKRYAIQIYFKNDELPVKKGDTIAFSGETGVGFAHLHYEHRSSGNSTLNALRRGLFVADHIAPTLEAIAVVPVVQGFLKYEAPAPVTFPLKRGADGIWHLSAPIAVSGLVGLAIKGFDRADAADNEFGIYRFSLFVNDSLVFSSARDSLSFDDVQQANLDYDYRLAKEGQGAFAHLFVEEGNRLWFYGPFRAGSGLISSPVRKRTKKKKIIPTTRVRIECEDTFGNRSCAAFELVSESDSLKLTKRLLALESENEKATRIPKGHAVTVTSSDGGASIELAERTTLHDCRLALLKIPDGKAYDGSSELRRLSPVYTGFPNALYFDKSVQVHLKAEQVSRAALFSWGGKGWNFNSEDYDVKKGLYSGRLKENVPFALFQDEVAPRLTLLKPRAANDTLMGRKLQFEVSDEGSGIDSDRNIVTRIDGEWVLSEYDFKTGRVTVILRNQVAGMHELSISLEDNLHNATQLAIPFILR